MPAQAGIQKAYPLACRGTWIPAFAEMTMR